ncbi:MAG TPA: peptide chain release factor N(5)-glutamine methyltransferase [Candidatus Limnocylindrales bacterium]|nr:peptide chain release factor N(5)-glutamine methyltransferase [Candidatus Limnocylindrales bacterium]
MDVNITNRVGAPRLHGELILAFERLSRGGIENPRLDAEVLLARCLNLSREDLLVAADLPISPDASSCFETFLQRRLTREPVAYITGTQEFWSLDFTVSPDVLIPRPDTERLVEIALLWAARFAPSHALRIADLCTGSGAVAVSLASELPSARIWATDNSAAALAIARGNASAHLVAAQIEFVTGDLFDALAPVLDEGFDLIVSNPPYVRRAEIATLAPEVSRWEPRAALDGGVDGLDFYRRIIAAAPDYLAEHGALALEIGADMAIEVSAIFASTRRYREIDTFQDYAGRNRVMLAQLRNT